MATRILFAPKQPEAVMEMVRNMTPAGFELVVADIGTPEFYEAAPTVEFYLGLARQMGGEFFRSATKLRLVQLLSAGYDHVDIEAARKAKVPVSNNGGANWGGAAFDPETGLAFASCGEGVLTVVHEDSPDKFRVAESVPTKRGARTLALDPAKHRIFVVTADFGPAPAPTAAQPRPRRP